MQDFAGSGLAVATDADAVGNSNVVSNNEGNEDEVSGDIASSDNVDDGVNVLMDDSSTDAEPDENDPLKLMNNTLSDCTDILGKARVETSPVKLSPYAEDDDLSLMTEHID